MSDKYQVERWSGAGTPDERELRAKLEAEGYKVLEWSDRPGITYTTHQHEEDQSHCIVSGQIEFTVENAGVFVLGAGDRDYLPAGTPHAARVVGDEVVFYLIGAKV
jgi:quercetin dioxygenase-like cupin family protein